MSEQDWLREALRRATSRVPVTPDLVGGAFAADARRRRRQAVAGCTVAVAALATSVVGIGVAAGGRALDRDRISVVPATSPPTAEPTAEVTYGPTAEPTYGPTAEPSGPGGSPAAGSASPSPAPAVEPSSGREPVPTGGPASSDPVDVYFLVDTTTSSATDTSVAAVNRLIDALVPAGDVWFGVGEFRDTDVSSLQAGGVYRRLAAVQPDGPAVREAADSLNRARGGGDTPEAATMALQASVGIGNPPYTPSDQPAGFRPDARKVVVLVTDAPTHEESPHPTIDDTVAELRARGVVVVGLLNVQYSVMYDEATDFLERVTEGTGGVTPSPVDCDGDGAPELGRGEPFVCDIHETPDVRGVARAVLRLVGR